MVLFWWLLRGQSILFVLLSLFCLFWGTAVPFFSSSAEVPLIKTWDEKTELEPLDSVFSSPFLRLPSSMPIVQLPDLKKYLQFLGRNERPDTTESAAYFHFSLIGDKETLSIKEGEKGYLAFQREKNVDRFQFSPSNQKTSLYFTCQGAADGVQICVSFESDIGMQVKEDDKSKQFILRQQPHLRASYGEWSIGGVRVDPSYLAKIKAKWYGKDLFFEDLGGEEFSSLAGKERILVEGGEKPYALYAKEGDFFLYAPEKQRWLPAGEVEKSEECPLLEVKTVDDRLMHFILWDLCGKRQQLVTMIKHPTSQPMRDISQEFHFSGAKTKKQFVFDIQEKKVTLTVGDWLLYTKDLGWIKIDTPELLSDYIEGKVQGDLLVLSEVGKFEEQKVLLGTLYSPCRSQKQEVHLPIVKEEIVFGNGKQNTQNVRSAKTTQKKMLPR
jgi:hypothetical protein